MWSGDCRRAVPEGKTLLVAMRVDEEGGGTLGGFCGAAEVLHPTPNQETADIALRLV